MRRRRLFSILAGASLLLPVAGARVGGWREPDECACCGAPPSERKLVERADGRDLRIGYCGPCLEHQAAHSSRVLALSLASVLLALVMAAGLPLLWPYLGLVGLVGCTCSFSLLPCLAMLADSAPTPPHRARGAAVFWGAGGLLLCAGADFAERLQALNGGALRPRRMRELRAWAWLGAGPLIGLCAATLAFFAYHPLLRIINLGPARVEVAIEGHRLASVDPTSNESPAAGALVRVPAGGRVLTVWSPEGKLLERAPAEFHSASAHLFAIAADDTCFWLETTGYGREQRSGPTYQPLPKPPHFWVLPDGIDRWFAANPPPAESNEHSSGGLMTALRQGLCSQAPQGLR